MLMYLRFLFSLLFTLLIYTAYCQQDVDLHLNATLLSGKNILKVKRDFHDPYLWVLAQNNEVYRINSLTHAIDDYTSQFSAYRGLQFVDIAGRSADTVFIATNSSNLIEYKKGILKVIGAADGIPGVINSVGFIYNGTYLPYNSNQPLSPTTILIGTAGGMCHYDYQAEAMAPGSSNVPARVFETTYRTDLFSALETGTYTSPVPLYPLFTMDISILGGYVWFGNGGFGTTLKTAYCTDNVVIDNYQNFTTQQYYPNSFMDFFWGTETGLFQNFRGQSNNSGYPQRKYLTGISVNKITSIFGLRAFGDSGYPGLIRENLLVGTDQGLYFSNSGYFQTRSATLPQYTFFHQADLGTKKINDICVNATSYAPPICEDGIWVAAIDGLYLLKPDYGAYINPAQKISAIAFDGANSGALALQICSNTGVMANLFKTYGTTAIQWYKDGLAMPNQGAASLNITQSGDYSAIIYDPCSTLHFETNHLSVTQIAAPVFTFNYADTLNYCDGSSATLKTNNNNLYQYRWYQDGVLNGNTTATLTTAQSGDYKVELSACSGTWVTTKSVRLNFIKVPQPVISADKSAYCDGQTANLTASVPIDASQIMNWQPYLYRWYTNGVLNGITTATMAITQPGKYKVEVTSCSGIWIASQEVSPAFMTVPVPVVTADKTAYCIGDAPELKISIAKAADYTIHWFLNGIPLPSNDNKTAISASQAGNYTVSLSSNLSGCGQLSSPYALKFDVAPTLSITQIINSTLCDGQAVTLQAVHSAGAISWSTGLTADSLTVKHSGSYSATLTTAAGCGTTQSVDLQFLKNPVLALKDATLCQFTNEIITLSAPAGFSKYVWNGKTGSADFQVNFLGKVTLTVTDNQGCTATQTINISNQCADIHIPNTFTPNADGTNDKWVISGLENDKSVTLIVYNRLGNAVYKANGYANAWDGTYEGKKLPAGVYYYVINARASKQVLSGSVTIIY